MVAITPLTTPLGPLTRITPFTYRDNDTYLTVLKLLEKYITDTLVPEVNGIFDEILTTTIPDLFQEFETELNGQFTEYKSTIDADILAFKNQVNAAIAAFEADQTTAFNDFTADINALVASINNRVGPVSIQRVTLTNNSYILDNDALWPTDHPVYFALKQDATGGRTISYSANIIGTVTLNTAPNALTRFRLFPDGAGKWILDKLDWSADIALKSDTTVVTSVVSQLAKYIPKLNTRGIQDFRLANWAAAFDSATSNAKIVTMGDSITEGTGNSTMLNRWPSVLQRKLCEIRGQRAFASYSYIPGYAVTSVAGQPVTRTGTITRQNSWGICGRSASLNAADAVLTMTFTGDRFKLLYFRGSTSGVISVVIDGGAPTLIETNSVRLGLIGANAVAWDSGALSMGTHTVVVTRDDSSGAGEVVIVEGFTTYNGDYTGGVKVLDGAYHGSTSSTFTSSQMTTTADAIVAAGGADLIIMAWGTNDGLITSAQFKTNIEAYISALRARGITCTILLLGVYKAQSNAAIWDGHMNALRDIAATDSSVAFLNLVEHMPDVPSPYNAMNSLGLFADNLHPSDAGSEWIAQAVCNMLNLRVDKVV